MSERRFRIVVCRGPDCGERRDSSSVHTALTAEVARAGLSARCEFDWQSCFGRCSQGPNVLVRELVGAPVRVGLADLPTRLGGGPRAATALYNRLTPANAAEIVDSHVRRGVIVRHLIETPSLGIAPSPALAPAPRPVAVRAESSVPEVVREDVESP